VVDRGLLRAPVFRERLHWRRMEDVERRIDEERARVEAEYRRILKSSVEFERRIRDRWREKCRAKNERIAELEQRVAELERRLQERNNL
jgi:polyhydroxyalkanoate synthesis regulator phasin